MIEKDGLTTIHRHSPVRTDAGTENKQRATTKIQKVKTTAKGPSNPEALKIEQQ